MPRSAFREAATQRFEAQSLSEPQGWPYGCGSLQLAKTKAATRIR